MASTGYNWYWLCSGGCVVLKAETNKVKSGLCYRCEHRAKFLETGIQPRCECGEINKAVYGCYMYKPVKPVVLLPDEDDDRPQFGPVFIAARSYYGGVADMELDLMEQGKGAVLYWTKKE